MAGFSIPEGTRVLVSEQTEVSKTNPYSREKLCPILAFYTENSWEDACERCMQILYNEGVGHTMTIHSQNDKIIREFALKKPVSRLLVNTPGALGGVGATTNLSPALTLGCGAVGGSATSDNISPLNLINIRRVAYGVRELSDVRGTNPTPSVSKPVCADAKFSEKPKAVYGSSFNESINAGYDEYIRKSKQNVSADKAVPPPVKCGEKKCEAPCESKAEAQPSVTSSDVENITKEIIRRLSAK